MPKLSHHTYRVLVFFVGICATISYRLVIVFNNYSSFLVEVFWYVGTIGFIWYFSHRFKIENKRDRLIERLELVNKVSSKKLLNSEDREALVYILKGLSTSLAKWNYIAIFVFSFLAMAYAIISDLYKLVF